MLENIFVITLITILLSMAACSGEESKQKDAQPYDGPKTVYGEAVKKARDLKTNSEEHRQEVEDLLDETEE